MIWYNARNMNERRINERFPISYFMEESGARENVLKLLDISKGGVCFSSSKKLQNSEEIVLKVYLKKKMFSVEIKTVYLKPTDDNKYIVGAKFCNLADNFQDALSGEIADIDQLINSKIVYQKKDISFREASNEYLFPGTTE